MLITTTGPAGVGKTAAIERVVQPGAGTPGLGDCYAVTYTREAAAVLRQRAVQATTGTIYSLLGKASSPFMGRTRAGATSAPTHQQRRIKSFLDPALLEYERTAPSRQPKTPQADLSERLHAWDGTGDPPFDLWAAKPWGDLKYILPLARLVTAARTAEINVPRLARVLVDEAQDMSACELAAARLLLADGGTMQVWGDPGQALYARAKGLKGNALPWAWAHADRLDRIEGGFRVGEPAASLAARALRPYWDNPAHTFAASHETTVHEWQPEPLPPRTGLALCYSRSSVTQQFSTWNLRGHAVVPSGDIANTRLIVCTGHAAKGAEADDVYLLPWSRRGLERLDAGDADAVRLLYVMLTRARRRVFVPHNILVRIGS